MAGIIPNTSRIENLLVKTDTSGGTTYVGQAKIGSATSQAVWQIFKVVTSSGVTTITWADSDDKFNNIWDNRASLSYG